MVTQRDIANELGVSIPLVSRVLSGKAKDIGIADETIERIQASAKRMGYRANVQARGLRSGDVRTLGVVVSDFEDPFFGHFMQQLEHHARSIGYSMLVESLASITEENQFKNQRISRMVILGSLEDLSWTLPHLRNGTPVIQVGHGPEMVGITRLEIDEPLALNLLMSHLSTQHVRAAAYLGFTSGSKVSRYNAFLAAAKANGICHLDEHVWGTDQGNVDHGAKRIERALNEHSENLPDVVICANDQLAIGALYTLQQHSIQIPDDIRICGFDDIPMASFTHPRLTTLRQPVEEMIRGLFAHMGSRNPPADHHFTPELMVRESA